MSSFVPFTCLPCTKEKSFPGYYTGRRMRFTDGKLVFEGDLQEIGDNLIYGFFGLHLGFFHHFFSTNSARRQRIHSERISINLNCSENESMSDSKNWFIPILY